MRTKAYMLADQVGSTGDSHVRGVRLGGIAGICCVNWHEQRRPFWVTVKERGPDANQEQASDSFSDEG